MEAKITEYAQYFAVELTLAGAAAVDQAAYVKVSTGISNLQREVWALSKVEVNTRDIPLAANLQSFAVKLQSASQGLTNGPDLSINYLLWAAGRQKTTITAVGAFLSEMMAVYDLEEPILMLPQNLYVSFYTFGANPQPAASMEARFWYRSFTMKEQDYWDLVQLQNPIIS